MTIIIQTVEELWLEEKINGKKGQKIMQKKKMKSSYSFYYLASNPLIYFGPKPAILNIGK
jgi:hypothetical protein